MKINQHQIMKSKSFKEMHHCTKKCHKKICILRYIAATNYHYSDVQLFWWSKTPRHMQNHMYLEKIVLLKKLLTKILNHDFAQNENRKCAQPKRNHNVSRFYFEISLTKYEYKNKLGNGMQCSKNGEKQQKRFFTGPQ